MRTLAIGDIHGCLTALDALLAAVKLRPDDRIITLGDYVDRGPDSAGVLRRLIPMYKSGRLVPLRGNHEVMMLAARRGEDVRMWLGCGGKQALQSYAPRPDAVLHPSLVPADHWDFLEHDLYDWYETDTHIFVHAAVLPDLPLDEQPEYALHWEQFDEDLQHCSGKVVVCGHTAQKSGRPVDGGKSICIDTHAYGGGWLTCLDVKAGRYWQANQAGETRAGDLWA